MMAFNYRNRGAGNLLQTHENKVSCTKCCTKDTMLNVAKGLIASFAACIFVGTIVGVFCSIQYTNLTEDLRAIGYDDSAGGIQNNPPPPPNIPPQPHLPNDTPPNAMPCPCFDKDEIDGMITSIGTSSVASTHKVDNDKTCKLNPTHVSIYYRRETTDGMFIKNVDYGADIRGNDKTCTHTVKGSKNTSPVDMSISNEEGKSCISIITQACLERKDDIGYI
mmetsp:Transcript_7156/g.8144  ORF Transcript_7156/g.8144 Transcript_7156/m.8144 type:complete len:221 (+) Transcript_7156:201-863(+)